MTKIVNEFELPSFTQSAVPDESAVVMPDSAEDTSMTISSPEVEVAKAVSSVYITASSINSTTYNDDSSDIAMFDVVFTVGVIDDNGTSRSYQVVKRIGIDKNKIAAEVQSYTPVSIVEGKKQDLTPKKAVLSETQRFKQLAGLA
jgi:hypothetical protein